MKNFMAELFLHWDLFLMMAAPIWHLLPYILIKDKLVRIQEIISSGYSAHAELDYICFQVSRTTKMTLLTPQIDSITGTCIQFFQFQKLEKMSVSCVLYYKWGTWGANGGMRQESKPSECPYCCISKNFLLVLPVMLYSVLDINYPHGWNSHFGYLFHQMEHII